MPTLLRLLRVILVLRRVCGLDAVLARRDGEGQPSRALERQRC